MTDSSNSEASKVLRVTLRMEPEEFEPLRVQFVKDATMVLGIKADEFEVLSYSRGCTKIEIAASPTAKRRLIDLLNRQAAGGNLTPEESTFLSYFQVMNASATGAAFNAPAIKTSRVPPLTWLHLSDLHCVDESGKYWASQQKFFAQFLKDLPPLLSEQDLDPSLVILTGDIAQSGRDSEYVVAENLIQSILATLPRKEVRLFTVPGNHDVDRKIVESHAALEQQVASTLISQATICDFLESPHHVENRKIILGRLRPYNDFARRLEKFGHPENNHEFFFTESFKHHDIDIALAGLNSAWRASSDNDRGNLLLGLPQIAKAIDMFHQSDVRIMAAHHPPASDWYLLADKVFQRSKMNSVDLVLRGHEHDPHMEFFATVDGIPVPGVSAGALYTREQGYPVGFNATSLDFDEMTISIHFWRLETESMTWQPDSITVRGGHIKTPFSTSMRNRIRAARMRA